MGKPCPGGRSGAGLLARQAPAALGTRGPDAQGHEGQRPSHRDPLKQLSSDLTVQHTTAGEPLPGNPLAQRDPIVRAHCAPANDYNPAGRHPRQPLRARSHTTPRGSVPPIRQWWAQNPAHTTHTPPGEQQRGTSAAPATPGRSRTASGEEAAAQSAQTPPHGSLSTHAAGATARAQAAPGRPVGTAECAPPKRSRLQSSPQHTGQGRTATSTARAAHNKRPGGGRSPTGVDTSEQVTRNRRAPAQSAHWSISAAHRGEQTYRRRLSRPTPQTRPAAHRPLAEHGKSVHHKGEHGHSRTAPNPRERPRACHAQHDTQQRPHQGAAARHGEPRGRAQSSDSGHLRRPAVPPHRTPPAGAPSPTKRTGLSSGGGRLTARAGS